MGRNQRNTRCESYNCNLNERVLIASIGAWLVGRHTDVTLRGTKEQINVVSEVLLASKTLHEELNRSGATVESVVDKVQKKNTAARKFEMAFGTRWPL